MNLPDTYRGGGLSVGPSLVLPAASSDRLDIGGLLNIFRRRLLLFVLIVATCVMLALMITLWLPNLYSASADVVLRTEGDVTPSPTAAMAQSPDRSEQVETHIQTIESREMAGEVYDELKLGEDPAFVADIARGGLLAQLQDLLGTRAAPTPKQFRDAALSRLSSQMEAVRLGTSYALRLTYTDVDPKRAARIANGYAVGFAASQVGLKQQENGSAIGILRSRMEQLRSQAQADFAAEQRYRIANNLPSNNAASLTEQELAVYNQQVAVARAAAAEDAEKLATARAQLAQGGLNVGAAQTSSVVQSLRSQRAQATARVAELSGRYLDQHPDLQAARRQLADIDAQIAVEVGRTLALLEADARASAQKLASLTASQGGARRQLAGNNSAMITLDDLGRKSQASQQLYESYLNRYKEAVARSGAEQADSRILSPAQIPGRPSSPNLPLNLVFGLLVGIIGGAGAAIAAEGGYAGLTTGDDVERRLGVRFLGGAPLADSVEPGSADALTSIADHPNAALAEAMRSILTSLRQSPNGRAQVIAITSALPDEGKTTLAASLARVAAITGDPVVLIDCDVARHGIARRFAIDDAHPGLREVMFGGREIADGLVEDQVTPSLSLLPITAAFGRGETILDKGKLNRIIAKLREPFPLIILDCAPVLPIADTREVAALADTVVMAVRWRKTPDSAVRAALKLLPVRAIDDLGVVLTQIDMRKRVRFGGGDASFFYKSYKSYYERA